MAKHVIVYSTKGGVGKSTYVLYFQRVLEREKKRVSVINLDHQEHVEPKDLEDSDIYIYDTAGVHSQTSQQLLENAKDVDSVIIVPIGVGRNDAKEVRFIANNLEKLGLLEKTYFTFNKVRTVSSKLLIERKAGLAVFGLNVSKASIRILDDIADHKETQKAINEFSKLVLEVINK